MRSLQQVLWVMGLGLATALVLKLAITRLYRIYIWFALFLCAEIARTLVLLPIPPNTNRYGWIFLTTQPLIWLFYVLVVLELYSLTFREHKGAATLSRWTLSFCLVLAVAVSALTLWADLSRPTGRFKILVYFSVIERGLIFSLVLFLLLITAFLAWFPITVRRNLRLHANVYSVYFLSSTMALFLRNLLGYSTTVTVSTLLLGIDLVCFAVWLVCLDQKGEEQPAARRNWQPEDEQRLMGQLDALSDALLRRPRA